MKNQEVLINNVRDSLEILSTMIGNAKMQGAQNFQMLYTLQNGLMELIQILSENQNPDFEFKRKWDKAMGWVPRVFEDHPLLDRLLDLDLALKNQAI